jgi:hypothetical protein
MTDLALYNAVPVTQSSMLQLTFPKSKSLVPLVNVG